jgi:glucan endo-1,3-alpha-glucosidase
LPLTAVLVGMLFGCSPARAKDDQHYVFAHYMVCFAIYGDSLDGYKRELRAAQDAGIDGFVLNVGAWTNNPSYVLRTKTIFQAARDLGTGVDFKLFFSLDMATLRNEYLQEIVRTYANDPCYFHYKGRPVVSTFAGGPSLNWKEDFLKPLRAEGIDVCFVPHFFPHPKITELPDESVIAGHLQQWSDTVDGMFYFGGAGTDVQLTTCNAAYTKVMHAHKKISMASFTPFYWGGWRYFETEGGQGTERQWLSIIKTQPEWVEIVTWNDFNESYICPISEYDIKKNITGLLHPFRYDHTGYLELSKYYIDWYKTGKQPKITKDTLVYIYRSHPKDTVTPDNARPVTARHGNVQDVIYLTTMLTAPAELRVTSGTTKTCIRVKKGIQQTQVPFQVGNQHFELYRKDKCLFTQDGEPISDKITEYNFFSITGVAY